MIPETMYNLILISVVISGFCGIVAAALLLFVSKKFYVETDPKTEKIIEAVPGGNCGACGFAGCSNFAETLIRNPDDEEIYCPVGGKEVACTIDEILGREISGGKGVKMKARLFCSGNRENARHAGQYQGIEDCRAAMLIGGSEMLCPYGCLGFGSCSDVCPVGGICIVDGIIHINEDECRGCGQCVQICPRSVIKMVPEKSPVYVACNSVDKGPVVLKICKHGCIGCGKCRKACPENAITLKEHLACIDYTKCSGCGECIAACPRSTIRIAGEESLTTVESESCHI